MSPRQAFRSLSDTLARGCHGSVSRARVPKLSRPNTAILAVSKLYPPRTPNTSLIELLFFVQSMPQPVTFTLALRISSYRRHPHSYLAGFDSMIPEEIFMMRFPVVAAIGLVSVCVSQCFSSSAYADFPVDLDRNVRQAGTNNERFEFVHWTTDGAWFIKTDRRMFVGGQIPNELSRNLREAGDAGERIQFVHWTRDGAWFIKTDRRMFVGGNIPTTLSNHLREAGERRESIQHVKWTRDGAWFIKTNQRLFVGGPIPGMLSNHIREAGERGENFQFVNWTRNGDWFIKTDKRMFAGGEIPEQLSQNIRHAGESDERFQIVHWSSDGAWLLKTDRRMLRNP